MQRQVRELRLGLELVLMLVQEVRQLLVVQLAGLQQLAKLVKLVFLQQLEPKFLLRLQAVRPLMLGLQLLE